MSRPFIPLCLAVPGLLLLGWSAPLQAQSEIHRCIGADGGAVFTDQTCAALQATPVRPAQAAAGPAPTNGPPPVLCAASVDELRQSVIDAFARRDTVRMAGLILWDGYGRGAAIADIRALSSLMKQQLLDVDTPQPAAAPAQSDSDDFFPPPVSSVAPRRADQLVLHTAGNGIDGSASAWRFDVVRQAGCLWLRNAN
ncbi:MAG TPA: DUF4124 domain-containing protein [Rhodanobacter sp.]|nr:DUF4124 domain-containing protein [Rhodanobacter sp.]